MVFLDSFITSNYFFFPSILSKCRVSEDINKNCCKDNIRAKIYGM